MPKQQLTPSQVNTLILKLLEQEGFTKTDIATDIELFSQLQTTIIDSDLSRTADNLTYSNTSSTHRNALQLINILKKGDKKIAVFFPSCDIKPHGEIAFQVMTGCLSRLFQTNIQEIYMPLSGHYLGGLSNHHRFVQIKRIQKSASPANWQATIIDSKNIVTSTNGIIQPLRAIASILTRDDIIHTDVQQSRDTTNCGYAVAISVHLLASDIARTPYEIHNAFTIMHGINNLEQIAISLECKFMQPNSPNIQSNTITAAPLPSTTSQTEEDVEYDGAVLPHITPDNSIERNQLIHTQLNAMKQQELEEERKREKEHISTTRAMCKY